MSGPHKYPAHFFNDAPPKRAPDPPPRLFVGDIVKYTGVFLKNTGQGVGLAGGQMFEVVPCDCGPCADGRWVNVRDRSAGRHCLSSTHAIEVPARADAPTHHIAVANLCRSEAIDLRNCP